MAGASKKSKKASNAKKSSNAKKALSFDEPAGETKRHEVRGKKESVPTAPARAVAKASEPSTSSAKDVPAQRSIRLVKLPTKTTTTTDGNETEPTVSSLGDSGGEESDFEIKARAKTSKGKKMKAALPKAVKAAKPKAATTAATKTKGKGKAAAATKPKAQKKPRAGKRSIKSVLEEEYAVPSPKKLRAAAAGALAFDDEDESDVDDGCGTPSGVQLFPDSPKTEDWRLAAAIDY